MNASAKN